MLKKKINIQETSPAKKNYTIEAFLPVTWLISSILFFLIAAVVAPLFWPQLDKADKATEQTALHIILGIAGIVVYLLEPIIWHNTIYGSAKDKAAQLKWRSPQTGKNRFPFFVTMAITLAELILIRFPAMVLGMFKPVLRAMILYVSLSFLNIGSGNLGENAFFVIPVTADILLYYLDMIAPNWKYNPVNVLVRLIRIKNRMVAMYTGSFLLIIHTALIYSLLLNVVYYDMNHHPENLKLKSLALWWLILTVYSRMSFINDDADLEELIRNTPIRIVCINILALIISFISFIWPFYFAS